MEDQGVILGTALSGKDFGNSLRIQTVGSQTVDSFRRKGNQLTGFQQFGCQFCYLGVFFIQLSGVHRKGSLHW